MDGEMEKGPGQLLLADQPFQTTSAGSSSAQPQKRHTALVPDETHRACDSSLTVSTNTALTCIVGPVYELLLTNGKGFVLFATENIPRGTRLLEESPLLLTPPSSTKQGPSVVDANDLMKKLDSLTPEQHVIYFDLCHDPKAARRANLRARVEMIRSKRDVIKRPLSHSRKVGATVKLYAIYQTNAVRLGDDQDSGTGIFPTTSRINHSCKPNLQIHYAPATQKLIGHAVRQINNGEELTINYHSDSCSTQVQRNAILAPRGFKCQCEVCTGMECATSDSRRLKMFELDEELTAYDMCKDERCKHHGLHPTPHQALNRAEKLLELFKAEAILDCELQDV